MAALSPPRPPSLREGGGQSGALIDRVIVALAAFVCLLFTASLRDVRSVLWVPPTLPALAAAPVGDAGLDVHVIDSEGRPVQGAVVRVFSVATEHDADRRSDGVVYFAGEKWTKTDDPLAFDSLPRGETWVLAYGAQKSRASARVVLDETRRTVTLALAPASLLAVRVIDDEGKPVADARISVKTSDPLLNIAFTDAEGRITFDRLGPAPFGVTVSAEGYDEISRSGVYPDVAPLEIKLERLGGFDISVLDANGEPASFAEVLVSGPGVWPARSTIADADGHASILGLYAGVFDLRARLGDEVSPRDLNVPLPRGKIVERTLQLETGRFVLVSVTDGPMRANAIDPPPIKDADVVLVEEGLSSFPLTGKTNDKGAVLLGPISLGPVSVSARAEGFVPRMVGLAEDDAGDVTIPLLRGGAIVGDVRDERGFPVEGATIEVFGTDLDGMPIQESSDRSTFRDDLFAYSLAGPVPLVARGELGVVPGPVPPIPHAGNAFSDDAEAQGGEPWVTRSDGTFRAAPVTPGRVQVLVRHPEYTEAITELLEITPGSEVKVNIVLKRGGRLEGRVLEEDRTPVIGARLEIAALEGTFQLVTYAAEDGVFAAASLPETVLISVYRPDSVGEVATRFEMEIPPDKRTSIEIVLPEQREPSTFKFKDSRGYPLSRVEVRVVSLDLETLLTRTLFTNDDGEITVEGARGMPLRIVAERPKMAPLVETLEAAEKEHTFTMADGRKLRGFVTGRGGREKIENADVTLYTLSGPEHVKTDPDGSFEVEDLAQGRIRLLTRAEGYAQDERVVSFEGDPVRTTELERIDLAPAGSVEGIVQDENEQPIAGARVGLGAVPTYLPVGKLPYGIVQTDADGRFELKGLPEGKVVLEAYSNELGRGRSEEIDVRADRTIRRVVVTIPVQAYTPPKVRAAGSLAITLAEKSGAVTIVDVPEGGEAEHASIEPGDRIVTLAGRPVLTIEDARERLSGPLGEDVIIEVERSMPNGSTIELRLRVRRESVRR